jgi:hypothetical protein
VHAFDAPMPANTLGKAFDLERRGRNIEPFVEGAAVLKFENSQKAEAITPALERRAVE